MAVSGDCSYYKDRLAALREIAAGQGLDAVIVTDLANIRHLCGFTGTNGLLAVTEGEALFFTDSRYTLQASGQVKCARVCAARNLDQRCLATLAQRGVGYIGLEAQGVTAARWRGIQKRAEGIQLVDLGRKVTELRMVKAPGEIAAMRAASQLAESALRVAAQKVATGFTEAEAAREFHLEAIRLGADDLSFPPIVAAGERGALPHAIAGDREFREGDLVVFDFGVKLDGYCSDQTVTLPVGKVAEEDAQVYQTVLDAQRAALGAIKPGVALGDIDRAARELITKAGHGDRFGHGTGHGIGLEIHEAPTVGPRMKELARQGMVFTVEPGIYLPDRLGVRLEDTVVVTADGFDRITSLPKELGALEI